MEGFDLTRYQEDEGEQKKIAGIMGKMLSGRSDYEAVIEKRAEKAKKCECESAVVGFMGVLLGNWRNDRKFKCTVCHQWSPLYFESVEKGVCGGSHGYN